MSNHTLKLLKWRVKNDEIQHIRKIEKYKYEWLDCSLYNILYLVPKYRVFHND